MIYLKTYVKTVYVNSHQEHTKRDNRFILYLLKRKINLSFLAIILRTTSKLYLTQNLTNAQKIKLYKINAHIKNKIIINIIVTRHLRVYS